MKDESLEQLLLKEIRVVYKYLLKIGASKEDAEDITQETLYKTIKNIDAMSEEKIRAWLFKVAINNYYNVYNLRKKREDYGLGEIESLKLLSEGLDEILLTKEYSQRVQRALNLLKPSYKNLMVLKYLMDFSYKEIGAILEISEYQVKTYLYRARNSFKNIWEGLNSEEG